MRALAKGYGVPGREDIKLLMMKAPRQGVTGCAVQPFAGPAPRVSAAGRLRLPAATACDLCDLTNTVVLESNL